MVSRLLGSNENSEEAHRVDYSVLSYGVLTLSLILVVDFVRHHLDHTAKHRPFFKTVLEGAYTELATLGIVELFLHLYVTYWKAYNEVKKEIFVAVHFLLFYTAILNAFQSCFLSFVSRRASRKMWIEPEMLDLNHYRDIREEFEGVHDQLCQLKYGRHWLKHVGKSDDKGDCGGDGYTDKTSTRGKNDEWAARKTTTAKKRWFNAITDRERYSRLERKYNKLLLQIRFHESKVLFLQSFRNLPLNLQISDYLERCELHVLQKLVNVRSVAWILLATTANLLYYILGVVTYMTGDPELVGQALIGIFFLLLVAFVGIAYLTYRKTKGIFRLMMKDKDLWISHDSDQDKEKKQKLLEKQLRMFWGSSPTIIISIIQFMQFAYALALSALIVFWVDIAAGGVPMHLFVLAVFVCYFAFLATIGQVIPQYTMCTSLAQMMNVKLLHETLAVFRLEEAQRKESAKLVDKSASLPSKQNHLYNVQSIPGINNNSTNGLSGMMICDDDENNHKVVYKRNNSKEINRDSDRSHYMANTGEDDDENEHALLQKMHEEGSDVDKVVFNYDCMKSGRSSSKVSLNRHRDDAVVVVLQTVDDYDYDPEIIDRQHNNKRQTKPSSNVYSPSDCFNERKHIPTYHTAEVDNVTILAENFEDRKCQHQWDGGQLQKCHSHELLSVVRGKSNIFDAKLKERNGQCTTDAANLMAEFVRKDTRELRSILNESNQQQGDKLDTRSGDREEDKHMNSLPYSNKMASSSLPKCDQILSSTSVIEKKVQSTGLVLSLRQRSRRYFLSRKYILLSNLFGTTVAFFMLAKRVEVFVHSEHIVSSEFLSYQFFPSDAFCIVTFWFVGFIFETLLIIWAFSPLQKLTSMREKKVIIAALLDLVLISSCLTLFLLAEKQRCCEIPVNVLVQHRSLTATEDEENKGNEDYHHDGSICNCPSFGSRLYGGLGMLEPFVSLMALRLLRHYVAKRLLEYYGCMSRKSGEDSDVIQNHRYSGNPFAVFDDHVVGHDRRDEDPYLVSIAATLWESTIVKHPDIVNEFGEFSGQILRVMLGVPLLDVLKPRSLSPHTSSIPGIARTFAIEDESKFSRIAIECSTNYNRELGPSKSKDQPIWDKKSVKESLLDCKNLKPSQPVLEAIDTMEKGHLRDDLYHSDLSIYHHIKYPDAILVRTMRRCDRRVLPILDEWAVVDVVITRYEIVYFDATDVESRDDQQPLQDSIDLLKSTKGGKNLRLRDVAVGRRIVGHLDLCDIHSVHVHRQLHGSSLPNSKDGLEIIAEIAEFWKRKGDKMVIASHSERCVSHYWDELHQDILTIKTAHGRTIELRFYSDLKEAIQHPDRIGGEIDECGNLFKTYALLWAQSIVRLCGREQLYRQHLPHHFDDTTNELRHYIIIHK